MQVISVKIADITVPPGRFRKDFGDLDALAATMRTGQLQPIAITAGRKLIFGERRVRAAQLAGMSHIYATVLNLDDPLQAEHDENEHHKPFTPSERVAIARAIEERIGSRQGKRTDLDSTSGQLAGSEEGKETRDKAAKQAGFKSTGEYRRAATVVDQGVPELVEAMDAGEVSPSAAAEVAKLPPAEQAEVVAAGPEAVKDRAAEARAAAPPPPVVETRPPPHQTKTPRGKRAPIGVGGEADPFPVFDRAYGPLTRSIDEFARLAGESQGRTHKEAQDMAGALLAHMKRWSARLARKGDRRT